MLSLIARGRSAFLGAALACLALPVAAVPLASGQSVDLSPVNLAFELNGFPILANAADS